MILGECRAPRTTIEPRMVALLQVERPRRGELHPSDLPDAEDEGGNDRPLGPEHDGAPPLGSADSALNGGGHPSAQVSDDSSGTPDDHGRSFGPRVRSRVRSILTSMSIGSGWSPTA
jgi:hypothetical protein